MAIKNIKYMTDYEFSLLCGTIAAHHNKQLLNEAEDILNDWLNPEDGVNKHLYICNEDGTKFELKPGFKLVNIEWAQIKNKRKDER